MSDGVWVGLDIGGSKVQGVALDTSGALVGQVRLGSTNGAVGVVATAALALHRLRALPAVAGSPLLGVGVGVPGVVDASAGHVSHAVNLDLGAGGLALRDALTTQADCPVVIENDVNAAALGAWHVRQPESSDLAYLSIGTGLAAGIVLGGRLRRGTRGAVRSEPGISRGLVGRGARSRGVVGQTWPHEGDGGAPAEDVAPAARIRRLSAARAHLHARQLLLFFAPIFSSSAIVAGNGCVRCSGLLAMSTVVCPARLATMTSAPRLTRY